MKQQAHFHCQFGVIKRSAGHSVVKKAAYNTREKLHFEKGNELINYRFKEDLLAKNILAPEGAQPWVFNREKHYNKVENGERRKDAQLGRTIEIGLLHQLTFEQNKKLLEKYLNKHFVSQGMIADYAIHSASEDGDRRNIHAHVILSMRHLEGDGFSSKKAREWNGKNTVQQWRKAWSQEANTTFNELSLLWRMDHRSKQEQNSKHLPQKHSGKKATNLERREGVRVSRVEYNDLVKEFNQLIDEITTLTDDEIADDEQTSTANFTSIVERTTNLLEAVELIQSEELQYWVETKELEGVEVDLEASKIASRYETLQQAALDLSGEVIERDRKRRRKPDRKNQPDIDNKTDLGQSKRYETPSTSGSSVDAVENTAELENKANPATEDAGQDDRRAERRDSSPAIHIPDTDGDRSTRERAAINIARRVAASKSNPKTVKSPTNFYRLMLAKAVEKSDPETVANAYKNIDVSPIEYDRRIYRYMRSKGFTSQQIRKAMKQASPATYRKSKAEADRYARRFNEWARKQQETEKKNRQPKRRVRRRM